MKPVQPPSKRDGSMVSGSERNFAAEGYNSANNQLFGQGYLSQGQSDNESGRISNPQNYKINNLNIRKVSPNQGGSLIQQPLGNLNGAQGVGGPLEQYSNPADQRPSNLPII